MRSFRSIIFAFALCYSLPVISQGTGCSNPYVLSTDAVCRNYTISAVTGTAAHCTDLTYLGIGRLTFFSFTTDNTGNCVLINLTSSGYQNVEVMLYAKCSGGGALQNVETSSSVCFNDGTGLWAPCETLALSPNTTYFLRVWTPGSGTLTLCARNYPPPNNTCEGATPIGGTPVSDNNACHKPGTGVTPGQLCAYSLENTAFYTYYVDVDGISVIMINNIICDNSAAGVVAGFQIGFFTGDCGELVAQSCYANTGGSVSAPTVSLPAGTKVTVAIDGMSGSNCTYDITAFNGVFLPVSLKHFTGWIAPESNILRWSTAEEMTGTIYEIERSDDGINFRIIGVVEGIHNSNSPDYNYEDRRFNGTDFYRLKVIGANGKSFYSNIIQVKRAGKKLSPLRLQSPAADKLQFRLTSDRTGLQEMYVIDNAGRILLTYRQRMIAGENSGSIDIQAIAKGVYYLILKGESERGYSFLRQ
jgi:hypothetical protein